MPSISFLPEPQCCQTWTELDSYCQLVERCWAQAPADRPLFKEIITQLRCERSGSALVLWL